MGIFARFIGWAAPRWASAYASNWLLIIAISAISIAVVYVQSLRLKVEKCRAAEISQEHYVALADKLRKELERTTNAKIEVIEDAEGSDSGHQCLRITLGELLPDPE